MRWQVDEESGTLRTIRRLDRERQSSYTLFVSASDGSSSEPVTAEVIISVDDVNDNRPTMLFPSQERFIVELVASRGDLSRGALVTRIHASDPDDGPNAELEYAVEYGNEPGLFDVDRHTGALTVAAEDGLDASRSIYRLVVSATDGGTPPLRTVADLEIRVNSSSMSPPAGALETHLLDHCTYCLLIQLYPSLSYNNIPKLEWLSRANTLPSTLTFDLDLSKFNHLVPCLAPGSY